MNPLPLQIPPPIQIEVDVVATQQNGKAKDQVHQGLLLYVVAIILLTALAWGVVGVRGHFLHEPYPGNSLLDAPEIRFTDFTELTQRVAHFGEKDMLTRTDLPVFYPYPLPSMYAFLFFQRLFHNPLLAYIVFVCEAFGMAVFALSKHVGTRTSSKLAQVAVPLTLFAAFPLLYLIHRGNIEGVIWVLMLLGIVAFVHNRPFVAATFWGVAASMKILPGLLFLLLLARRKHAAFVLAVIVTGALVLLSLVQAGPTIRQTLHDSSQSAIALKDAYMVKIIAPEFDISPLGTIKQGLHLGQRLFNRPAHLGTALTTAFTIYTYMAALVACIVYWFGIRKLPLLNQFIALLLLYVLLPQVSYEYRLVQIYLGWGAFLLFLLKDVREGRVDISPRAQNAILLLFAILFTPMTYLTLGHSYPLSGTIKCCALLIMLAIVLSVKMPSSLFGDLPMQEATTSYKARKSRHSAAPNEELTCYEGG